MATCSPAGSSASTPHWLGARITKCITRFVRSYPSTGSTCLRRRSRMPRCRSAEWSAASTADGRPGTRKYSLMAVQAAHATQASADQSMLSLLRDEVCHRRSRAWCSRAGYTPLTRRAGRSRRRTSCAAVIALCMAVDLLTLPLGALAQTSAGARVPRAGALNPGDVVRITVWRKPELSGEFVIAADGTVSHPLYRDVRVTGLPLDAVDARIREFLGKLEANPQFVIAA